MAVDTIEPHISSVCNGSHGYSGELVKDKARDTGATSAIAFAVSLRDMPSWATVRKDVAISSAYIIMDAEISFPLVLLC